MSTVRRLVRALGLQVFAGLAAWTIVATVAANVDTAELDVVAVLLMFGQPTVTIRQGSVRTQPGPRPARGRR